MSDAPIVTAIAPVAAADRPRWSIMIPTYNSAPLLAATLESVLAQDAGPADMQIEVVDDASTDDVASVVRDVGRGRVAVYRQPRNVGHAANFDMCIQRARGHLVHLLHGDDAVLPDFYDTMGAPFAAHSEVGAAFCRTIYADGDGHWTSFSPLLPLERGVVPDPLALMAARQPAQPPSIVVRRAVYEHLGGFDRRFQTCAEDWEMYARVASRYAVWYEPTPLAVYRRHAHSLAVSTYRRHDPALPRAVARQASELAALWMLMIARTARESRDDAAWLRQIWEAARTSRSRAVLRRLGRELVAQGRDLLRRPAGAVPEAHA